MNNFYTKIKNDLDDISNQNNYENIFDEIASIKVDIDSLREEVFNEILDHVNLRNS